MAVLEAEVYDVDPAKTGMTPRDFLLYCYYGGLIHIGKLHEVSPLHLVLRQELLIIHSAINILQKVWNIRLPKFHTEAMHFCVVLHVEWPQPASGTRKPWSAYFRRRRPQAHSVLRNTTLLKHTLSALCAAARKRYPEALECLLAALTAPSMVSNAITVAAYKKWALVNLIHNGKLPGLPRWAPVAVSRAVKLEGGPYQVRSLCTWCRHPFGYLFAFSVERPSNGVEMSRAVKLEDGPCQVPSQSSKCGCVDAFIRHACEFDVLHMLPT